MNVCEMRCFKQVRMEFYERRAIGAEADKCLEQRQSITTSTFLQLQYERDPSNPRVAKQAIFRHQQRIFSWSGSLEIQTRS